MLVLIAASSFALCFVGLVLHVRAQRARIRRERLQGLELRPNCLLTRYPIVFLSGSPSLFRPFDHWNDVPVYLREHGYEVLVVEPYGSDLQRADSILRALEDISSNKCHVIADASQSQELETLARSGHSKIATLTLVRSSQRSEIERRQARASVDELRPMTSAIEIFEVEPVRAKGPRSFARIAGLLLLRIDNAINWGRRPAIDPIEVAEPIDHKTWTLEERFLNLAISLAERDARWSD